MNKDFENPRHTLAKMANDLQFKASPAFICYCQERNLIEEKGYNEYYKTTQYKINWKEVEKYFPKNQ